VINRAIFDKERKESNVHAVAERLRKKNLELEILIIYEKE